MATILFHLDENIPYAVAEGLRRRGIDVTTTAEAGLLGADDLTQLAYARDHGRVLVTQDEDLLVLHSTGVEHAGIAFAQHQGGSIGAIIRGLVLIWSVLEPEDMRNRVEYI
jgi:hypothetical protein